MAQKHQNQFCCFTAHIVGAMRAAINVIRLFYLNDIWFHPQQVNLQL
jgi:hypothetical protein